MLHTLTRLLWATALAFILTCCQHGSPSESETQSIRDSLATLRQQGKKERDASRYDEALRLHIRGLDMARAVGDSSEWIQALNNIATDYRRMGMLDVAQSYHYQALSLCDESSDTTYQMRKNRVKALNGLGNIYLSIYSYDDADSVFRQALEGEHQLGSATGQAINYANLGSIYSARGDDEKALDYYRQSMFYNKKDSNLLGMALCHLYFGNIYERRQQYDLALREYEQSDRMMTDLKDLWHALEPRLALASVYYHTHEDAKALALLDRADATARQINSWEHIVEVHHLYFLLMQRQGRYREALDHHLIATAYQDSILDNEKLDRIHNIGINIERTRQQKMVDMAQNELQTEKRIRQQSAWLFGLTVILLLAVISALLYVQRMRHRSMEMMREASRLREDFFTNITHEFRTPLTVILGLSRKIRENTEVPQSVSDKASTIERQGNRLLTLVTQLLDISKVKSVIGEPNWQHGNICAQVAMLLETYIDYAANRGVTLKYHYDKAIEMDFVPDYVNKVMSNLVSNALKFTPNGGTISVNLYQRGDRLHIDVSDTGHGISSDKLAHIFEPFYTTGDMGEAKGTGIGLALTQEIISHLNGTITAESQVGKGTTFHIVMPIQNRSADPVTETEIGNSGKPIIVVAEDNADVADLLCSQLEPFYEVVAARDGVEALKRAGEIIPDLVITDVMMPNMDGMALARAIRANDLTAHIPIIMVTARVTEQDRIEGIKAGADAYLVKPFNTEELLTRVAKLLEQRIMLRDKYAQTITQAPVSDDAIEDHFLARVEQVIVAHINKGEDITVTMVADDLNITARQLHRKVTGLINQSPAALIRITRINCAKTIMAAKPEMPLKSVALACGFTDYSHFAKVFRTVTGVSPTAWTAKPTAQ
ncbi:ATP-binding protein [Prevotella sp. P5-108]|uniref:hybrid sensor histidine kinase/response regulator transcription factor n=1 Tax=Prevotella sp. P5-108 TaxID=2024225 RepID=UPI001303121C|nr:ATP-binding protein [Prevotella sp. P5-108]